MASKPGILTQWPWGCLGNYKYVVLAPMAIYTTSSYLMKNESEKRDMLPVLVLPLLISRFLHNQIWISISRHRTAQGTNRIVDRSIEFEQVDRESNWDDQIIFNGLYMYLLLIFEKKAQNLPFWRTDGMIWTFILHAGPVEYTYYWLHRALHHHFLYSRYHSHHHSSIVTEPITSVIHPFAEHIAYYAIFSIPFLTTIYMGKASILSIGIYLTYIDFMNNLGHCNFELIPKWLFSAFPPLKYLIYTPSFHSLHHTQFQTNYSLFMPFYDYLYGTEDKSSDTLYERSLVRKEEIPDVVHLTHLTTPESIFHLRIGFAHYAATPQKFNRFLWLMWPITLWSMFISWIYGQAFTLERNVFKHLKLQTWAISKYSIQYLTESQRKSVNSLIEKTILEADGRGVKVMTLGLLNQDEHLNNHGEIFLTKNPQLKLRLVDGSSLAVAVVLHSIPKGTTQLVLTGKLSKVAYSLALELCQGGIKVFTMYENEYKKLKQIVSNEYGNNLLLSKGSVPMTKTWLIGEGVCKKEQIKAPKGTTFIPFSHFPPKEWRKDCTYHTTPAMLVPKHLENIDSCENWLPRRVMSAWRIAGIVHAMEQWNVNEFGKIVFDISKTWEATLRHGFIPLM
ncbi:hypothetical protein M569_02856, partial [Genlisea aurea]